MKPEDAFEEKLRRDLAGQFWIENVEQRHTRGYPDINLIDLFSDRIALIELKVTYKPLSEYCIDNKITIESLKSHQINWLESRAIVGDRDRKNIGMLLYIDPYTFYIKGKDVANWRGSTPILKELFNISRLKFRNKIDAGKLREYMFGEVKYKS